jgi:hypothetical protein
MGRKDVRRTPEGEPLPDDYPKCGAKKGTKRAGSEGFCQQPAGAGTDHLGVGPCHYHMGSTPAVTQKYKEFQVVQGATKLLAKLDVAPVDNPLLELAILAGQAVAWKNAMAQRVNAIMEELDREDAPVKVLDDQGVVVYRRDEGDIRYTSKEGTEQLRSEVLLWERAMARCESVLVNISRLNIDERLAAIDEATAATVTKALLTTLQELEIDPEVRRQARKIVGTHLRRVQ